MGPDQGATFVNDDYFRTAFSLDNFPSYQCPGCHSANLHKIDFLTEQTAASKRESSEYWWQPDYEMSIYRMTLKCPKCDAIVHSHGDGIIEEEYEEDPSQGWSKIWISYLRPKNFFPPLKFIDYPIATSKGVQEALDIASAMYYSHPAASCNYLRIAAEEILTSLGVPEAEPGKFVTFSSRMKSIPESSSVYGLLDALRWLGNDGSHAGTSITHLDAEDAFRVIDLLVEEVYSERKNRIHELAAAIREHKGPIRSRGVNL